MAAERLTMRQIREILRQKWLDKRPHREVCRSLTVSSGAVSNVLARATRAELDWARVEGLDDAELETLLYRNAAQGATLRAAPDPQWIHAERSKSGVTLQLLHLEYLEKHPDGYRYTQFCELYRRWAKSHRLSMRQVHRGGEKLFVDYSGKKPCIVDPKTGVVTEVELFVGVMGASNFTYAEATHTQRSADFINAHVRCLESLGGVPRDIVPDQLKSGVTNACRYEPTIQRTYEELAQHYGTTIVPARPAHPKDKAKVERGVQIVQRWVLARIRHRTFFSLTSLNEAIAELVDELNDKRMKTYGASRRELFERLDRPALRALPQTRFVFGEWSTARVNIDYHVEVGGHYYSVPHGCAHDTRSGQRSTVDVRATANTVEVFLRGERIASHMRSHDRGRHTTCADHMPSAHRAHAEWSPSRIIGWAATVGPETTKLVEAILSERRHPEQGYRSCLGILRLAKRYGGARLEAACLRAVAVRARSYRHVEAILKNGLDRVALPANATTDERVVTHENVRGPGYYH